MSWTSIPLEFAAAPLTVILGAYALLAVLLHVCQRRLIYRPDPRRRSPEDAGLAGVETLAIETPDGETVLAWYAGAEPGRPTILYFHGNRGWVELRAERMAEFKSRGFGVMMPSYRGYGGSSGRPSELSNVDDAKTAYGELLARGVKPSNIVVFGESLGTGIATQLATQRPIAGLVLDSPYTSMTDVGALRYPWLPVSWLLVDRYETLRHIPGVKAPVLVLHGANDRLIPAVMGRAVHAAAPDPKALAIFDGAGHLDHSDQGSFYVVADFIEELPKLAEQAPSRVNVARPAVVADADPGTERKRPEAVPQAFVVAKV